MESPYPHRLRGHVEQILNPAAHFLGRLIGKSDRKNAVRRHPQHLNLPSYAMHQNAGFAATSTSQNQHGLRRRGNCLTLGIIERVYY